MSDPKSLIKLVNEPYYSFGSPDNVRCYNIEVNLTKGYRPSSIHGVIVDDKPTIVVANSGGQTNVHAHSLLVLSSSVLFAVGSHIVCFTLGRHRPDWILEADEATCFGIYYDRQHDALISHGELAISRFSMEGDILWSAGGADVFSEGFKILPKSVRATDFTHKVYHFDYLTGQPMAE